ncbi:hypothetical protein, partial [Pseudoalteromonas citrea]|uniref:hypothetical protein n=1 Tax=Pseudoalteromonas citrea TaxID=43655 RepID=UPI001BB16707
AQYKALLCSNSGLLQMKATPRVRKIALLGKFAYPELRLTMLVMASCSLECHIHSTVNVVFTFAPPSLY